MNVKRFHIEWDNHLREKLSDHFPYLPVRPMELESDHKTISWEYELDDGTIIRGSKEMSIPPPLDNPFDDTKEPEEEEHEYIEDDED